MKKFKLLRIGTIDGYLPLITLPYLFLFFSTKTTAQTENVNPKGNWYFGVEAGTNEMASYSGGGYKNSYQAGVMAEYYFARHWSVYAKLKYFETGVSFYSPNTHTGSWLDMGSPESSGTFKGAVIALPVDIKWEFRLYKNLSANFNLGASLNWETKNEYNGYSHNQSPDKSTIYPGIGAGYGLNYFFDKNLAAYMDVHGYSGSSKGTIEGFWGNSSQNAENVQLSVGVKYNFGT